MVEIRKRLAEAVPLVLAEVEFDVRGGKRDVRDDLARDAVAGIDEVLLPATIALVDATDVEPGETYRAERLKRPLGAMIVMIERLSELGWWLSDGMGTPRVLEVLRDARRIAYHVTAADSGIFEPEDHDYQRDRAAELETLRGDLLEFLRGYAETLDPAVAGDVTHVLDLRAAEWSVGKVLDRHGAAAPKAVAGGSDA